jgi:hypothetical protein
MKVGFEIGAIIGVLLSIVAYLVELVDLKGTLALMFLLVGLWTLVSAFTIIDPKDRYYYTSWGVVIAFLALFDFIPFNYVVALIIVAVVAIIVINIYIGRAPNPKVLTAATTPPPSAGESPAAKN